MSKAKVWALLLATAALMAAGAVKVSTERQEPVSIRKIEPQVVIYTIHRGSYEKAAMAIGQLYALAGKNQIRPRGNCYYVYLNNPNHVSSEHWLTEVRIPVGKDALNHSGKIGAMTDVKTLPAFEVAVVVKPEGQADPSAIYSGLHSWAIKNGYVPTGSFREAFLTNSMSGNYKQMKTEIMLPVVKIAAKSH